MSPRGPKTGKAHVIKSHHNVGGLPEDMKLKLVEPLRELFKDEVRRIGLELGLPYDMVYRHPFPGPGLGVRVLGEVRKEYCDVLRRADAIFIEELHRADCYNKVSQAFAVFLPVRSVGVVGDARRYSGDYPACGGNHRLHDRALGAAGPGAAGESLQSHHERNRRCLARGLRYFQQAAGNY